MNEAEEYRRGRAAIGPIDDGRLDLFEPGDRVHQRNLDHLHAYARARRIHTEAGCDVGGMCYGWAVLDVLSERVERADQSYTIHLLASAIARIDDLTARAETAEGDVLGARLELQDEVARRTVAEEEAAALRHEVAEAHARIGACEEAIRDIRAEWPVL